MSKTILACILGSQEGSIHERKSAHTSRDTATLNTLVPLVYLLELSCNTIPTTSTVTRERTNRILTTTKFMMPPELGNSVTAFMKLWQKADEGIMCEGDGVVY